MAKLAFGERTYTRSYIHTHYQQLVQIKSKWISLDKIETMQWFSNSNEVWLFECRKEVILIFVSTGRDSKLIGWLFGKLYILTKMLQATILCNVRALEDKQWLETTSLISRLSKTSRVIFWYVDCFV